MYLCEQLLPNNMATPSSATPRAITEIEEERRLLEAALEREYRKERVCIATAVAKSDLVYLDSVIGELDTRIKHMMLDTMYAYGCAEMAALIVKRGIKDNSRVLSELGSTKHIARFILDTVEIWEETDCGGCKVREFASGFVSKYRDDIKTTISRDISEEIRTDAGTEIEATRYLNSAAVQIIMGALITTRQHRKRKREQEPCFIYIASS